MVSVKITYRSEPFYPAPLPGIDEERLVRERSCAACELRYAVFGEHRFCPVCGLLPPLVNALDALAAEVARLDLLQELTGETMRNIRENGVLDRTHADTIENVVGIVEATAEQTFRELVSDSDVALHGKGNVFQRLDGFADLFQTYTHIDLRDTLGDRWDGLHAIWAARHVFTHRDGDVDDRYLRAVSAADLRPGQRLRVTSEFARDALRQGEALVLALGVPAPQG